MVPTRPWRLQLRSVPWTLPLLPGHRCEKKVHHHYWHRVISAFLHHAADPNTWIQSNPCNRYAHLSPQGQPIHHKPSKNISHRRGLPNFWEVSSPITAPASTQGCAHNQAYWGPISKGGLGIQGVPKTYENASYRNSDVVFPTTGATSKGGHPNLHGWARPTYIHPHTGTHPNVCHINNHQGRYQPTARSPRCPP